MRFLLCLGLFLSAACASSCAASGTLQGDWREPGGSVIRIAPCGPGLCATLVAISPQAPTLEDAHNPDATHRHNKLCGLVIGQGFHADSATHADGGTLYDPKSGKTYRGEMTANGDQLALRGYLGVKLFGRTETWVRTTPVPACHS